MFVPCVSLYKNTKKLLKRVLRGGEEGITFPVADCLGMKFSTFLNYSDSLNAHR